MSEGTNRCTKCNGEMVRGYLFSGVIVPWFEGEPQEAILGGAKPPSGQGLPNATFRCAKCGYLEMFAGPEYGPK